LFNGILNGTEVQKRADMSPNQIPTATSSSSIADILERVLDKGIVIAGDIRVKLVDVELLSIQIRLVICSIEKAKEIGMDWWNTSIENQKPADQPQSAETKSDLTSRLECIESRLKAFESALTEI